ncbi:MbeB family mobilization protein [Escherichia coli]|uniref:MbeB family mobilization protein n=1 Tax=Escherichia coli TaxID=562 RepID=UPI002022ED87|nr:MbeB family mobilization protein [Escherichia coli]
MSNLLQTGAEFEKKLKERAESTETMLNDEFSKLEKSVSKAVTSNETKIKDAIALFTASTEESLKSTGKGERGDDAAQEGRVKAGREYGHDVTGDGHFPVYRELRDALVSWRDDTGERKISGSRKRHCRN